ncbi:putative sodium-coupled neutral amino acid transporter 10 [Nylanderia fulva]|uniref:putative sodium-coupled neutral amino acid transporter 10 n=1 Tax=Nylanderia fulva TaxID=613905 RepID=UPI0010FB7651|nr:putative sodium-coupled neutral amino acid transporter 10 [Nylanderia fulva]
MPTMTISMEMIELISQVMTPVNSFVGVSLLTMPYCFKQCGIVLATLILILCHILSRLACRFLIKSSVLANKRKFVLLASHTFGMKGKFLAKILIVGFMLGTCVAYFIVIGDLGFQLVQNQMDNVISEHIRTLWIIVIEVFVVFFVELCQNIDYLFDTYIISVSFYLCVAVETVIKFFIPKNWWSNINWDSVDYWRLAGIPQCLPIFFIGSFCHIQLLEMYEMTSTTSLKKMNKVAGLALNICTVMCIIVGFFGYIRFGNTQSLAGNILLNSEPDMLSEFIKLLFIVLIVFNFPLVIRTCRNSLYSLLFNQITTDELFVSHLSKFKCLCLTVAIATIAMVIAILMPSLEFVLSIIGSTIGVMILIFPTTIFVSITTKNNGDKLLAQCIMIFGICIIIILFGLCGRWMSQYISIKNNETIYIHERNILQFNKINRVEYITS